MYNIVKFLFMYMLQHPLRLGPRIHRVKDPRVVSLKVMNVTIASPDGVGTLMNQLRHTDRRK